MPIHYQSERNAQTFVVSVPRGRAKAGESFEIWRRRVLRSQELKWLKRTNTHFSMWRNDWDVWGWFPSINIPDAGQAALFKLTFG